MRVILPLLVTLATLLLSAPTHAQFFWLQFLQPVDEVTDLPTCANNGLEENRARFVRDSDLLTPDEQPAIYFCPDGGGAWQLTSGSGGGAGDVEKVGDCDTGECFQSTTATQVFAAPVGGGVAAFRPLTDADVPNTITIDLAATSTALAADPVDCSSGNYVRGINASGVPSCFPDVDTDTDTDDQVASEVPYTVDDGAEWPNPDPTNVDEALENIAPRLPVGGAAAAVHTHPVSDLTGVNAGTNIANDLEEEIHAIEHNDGGDDEISLAGLAGLSVTPQTAAAHELTSAFHTESGLSAGNYLRATGATTFDFSAILEADIPSTIARDTELPLTFLTHNAPTGTDPVADTTTDTINYTGTTILISGTSGSDTLDFEVASYSLDMSNMTDSNWDVFTISGGNATMNANVVALTSNTTGDYVSSATANQGLLVTGTEGASVGLMDCAANQILKRNAGDTAWECAADETGGGGGSMPQRCYVWPAGATAPLQVSDSIAVLALAQGANLDHQTERYDDTTDECRGWSLLVPPNVDTTASATFGRYWYPSTASTNTVVWDIRHVARSEGEQIDAALTIVFAAADAGDATQGELTHTSWTSPLSTLGWTANELALGEACRDANGTNGIDNLVGDAASVLFYACIPEAE